MRPPLALKEAHSQPTEARAELPRRAINGRMVSNFRKKRRRPRKLGGPQDRRLALTHRGFGGLGGEGWGNPNPFPAFGCLCMMCAQSPGANFERRNLLNECNAEMVGLVSPMPYSPALIVPVAICKHVSRKNRRIPSITADGLLLSGLVSSDRFSSRRRRLSATEKPSGGHL